VGVRGEIGDDGWGEGYKIIQAVLIAGHCITITMS
jgi:hypothetical protein